MLRKFYAATTEGGGAAAEVVEGQEPEVNMAALMAKHGTKSSESSKPPEPIDINGKKVETKAEEPAKAATAEPEKKLAETKPEPEKKEPVKEEKKAETAPIVAEKPKSELTLAEVLKNNQPDTVLKALGFDDKKVAFLQELGDIDDKVIGIIQAWKNGTLGDYTKELGTDYSKMDAEEVMRHQLRKDYPKATARQLEVLYKREVVDAYNLDSEDPDELAEGKELLAAKADRYRDSFIENQSKYLMPKPPEPKAEPKPDNTAEIEAQKRVEAYRKELNEHPYMKNIIANKKITLGEGEQSFNYPVDAQELVDVLSDPKKWMAAMWDVEKGEPKTEHQLAVAAFALDSKKFLKEYADHLKSIGAKEVIDPIENASSPDKSTPAKSEEVITDPAKAMAKHGRRVPGGNAN